MKTIALLCNCFFIGNIMKISFCTTCMGRLHHLKQTLPVNIISTGSYTNREFIVLNYNSPDHLHLWAKNELKPWIKSGVVKYYRTLLPQNYSSTHAKNIVHRQANGDILCNLDADNFIVDGFCEFLNEMFSNNHLLISSSSFDIYGNTGCCGKIAVKKDHFYSVNGYDESQYLGWGWDDTSFQFRTRMQNKLANLVCDVKWNRVIQHSNEERVAFFQEKDLEKSKNESIEMIKLLANKQDYVVNKNVSWGISEDLHQMIF